MCVSDGEDTRDVGASVACRPELNHRGSFLLAPCSYFFFFFVVFFSCLFAIFFSYFSEFAECCSKSWIIFWEQIVAWSWGRGVL